MAKSTRKRKTTRSKEEEKEASHEEEIPPPEEEEEEQDQPKPVSSDESGSEDEGDAAAPISTHSSQRFGTHGSPPMSRLFAPYRTLGIVSSGRPFVVLSHELSTMLCVPIHDRFQILSERLQPLMVSQQVSVGSIRHLVADATLSTTVVAHGSGSRVTLFHRTKPLQSRLLGPTSWFVASMLHLGRMKQEMTGEKEGKLENAAIVAVILSCDAQRPREDALVVGEDEESEAEDDSREPSGQSSGSSAAAGQVVIVINTRQDMTVQRRIPVDVCPVAAVHPPTYVNKILVAGYKTLADGSRSMAMSLFNVRSGKRVHSFQCLPPKKNVWITTLEASPAVDTIAIGNSCGDVYLVNLLHDKLLFSLHHKSMDKLPVSITSISFRTDASAFQYGIAPMAVGRDDGTITVWDLTPSEKDDGRTLLTELECAHVGGIGDLQYLPHEPLLVSTGTTSNSIKMHLFDSPNHTGRVLRQRVGHSSPPTLVRYLHPATGGLTIQDGTDASACQILSTGGSDRSLRIFSTARTVLDKEYSQGTGLEKRAKKLGIRIEDLLLPPVTALAMSEANRREWGDLVTIHKDHPFAYVWSTTRGSQAGPLLKQADWNISAMKRAPSRQTHATAVCMSACGHFALVGTRGGTIYKYNVQSGHTRGAYPRSTEDIDGKRSKRRQPGDVGRTMKALEKKMKISNRSSNLDKLDHEMQHKLESESTMKRRLAAASHQGFEVTGLAVDSVNKVLISVGRDRKLILWHFATHAPHRKSPYTLPSPAAKLNHIRESDLAAIALEDFSVVLFDCSTLSIVRRFGAQGSSSRHTGPITDICFSPDARTLYTASMDSTIRVFDVPTNSCIDWLSFKSPAMSLTVSPTGEYLATTHVGRVGICVWSDRSYYQTVHVDGYSSSLPTKMDEPLPMADKEPTLESSTNFDIAAEHQPNQSSDQSEQERNPAPIPKSSGLVTFSGLPPAHWKNLFHLELVKERNKPKEAPKKPPTAPFFLQWRSGEPLGEPNAHNDPKALPNEATEEEWAKAWSDEEDADETLINDVDPHSKRKMMKQVNEKMLLKRPKISHVRSQLASLLLESADDIASGRRFQHVTDYISSLGPSAIDVALASLCYGIHDLEEGLPLLLRAANWLIEAVETGERFEAINAYLSRFLFLHATIIASLDTSLSGSVPHIELRDQLIESVSRLRLAEEAASAGLNRKLQHSLCLLRHFSRMV